jgi:hypothetical protein
MTQPVDLPLPLRASGSSTPRDETVAQAATAAVVIPQRAIEEPGPVPALPLTNVQQQATAEPATPAAAGAGGPSGGRSEGEMEELARRLYEHIGTRLRAELLVERERAGMVTDLR